MKIYIGYDHREEMAFDVAAMSARQYGCDIIPLREDRLRLCGLVTRPMDTRGQMWDLHSGAPQSTAFAIARFWAFLLAHSGWCLFVDGDVVFLRNPEDLMAFADPQYAVMVVKHPAFALHAVKMDGQVQQHYDRKLWSSVMLINVDHPANQRLNAQMLNQWPGRDLHAFKWLADNEIGALPPEWNWLVGMQEKPTNAAIAHFTLGTPDMVGEEKCAGHAGLWLQYAQRSSIMITPK